MFHTCWKRSGCPCPGRRRRGRRVGCQVPSSSRRCCAPPRFRRIPGTRRCWPWRRPLSPRRAGTPLVMVGSPLAWFFRTLFSRSTMWSPPAIMMPTPVNEKATHLPGQKLLLPAAMLWEARQWCTPEIVPVFRNTRPAQLPCSRLSVTRPLAESRTRIPQRSSYWQHGGQVRRRNSPPKSVLYWILKSASGELQT
jgi:hypothetical protein